MIFFSWDSMGCESGIDINLRESSERDDISRNIDLLELEAATPVDKQVFLSFLGPNSPSAFS